MKKVLGIILLIVGVLWALFSAFIVYKWSNGDYVVHQMTYQEFADRHSDLDEYSFLKITGGRIDVEQTFKSSLRTGEPGDQRDYFERVYAPYVGSDLRNRGIALEIDSGEVDQIVPALSDSSVTERYMPLVVEGYFSYGAHNELEKNAFDRLGLDYDSGIVIVNGVQPVSVFRRVRGAVISLTLIVLGVALITKKKT